MATTLGPRVAQELERLSLHVYSRPCDTCIAYNVEERTAREMRLQYHSVDGKLGERLQ